MMTATTSMMTRTVLLLLLLIGLCSAWMPSQQLHQRRTLSSSLQHEQQQQKRTTAPLFSSTEASLGQPTELPDSLDDAAQIAAEASAAFYESMGVAARCRVDFDTSIGDETYTLLKSTTEYMQQFVGYLCNALIPGVQQERLDEMMRVSSAKASLREWGEPNDETDSEELVAQRKELILLIKAGGRTDGKTKSGPIARIYFPDEGSAALARRDWAPKLPQCVQFSSCGGVQVHEFDKDVLIFFYCPKASESDDVEALLLKTEEESQDLKLSVFVNPNLVDMGVTGFGMAGRLLRERLIDPLTNTYYLRTLPWGALTRTWPRAFSVWQEDADAECGYRLISTQSRLPSNPEVEDIYDMENGLMAQKGEGGGPLDALGDFVNGMMKL